MVPSFELTTFEIWPWVLMKLTEHVVHTYVDIMYRAKFRKTTVSTVIGFAVEFDPVDRQAREIDVGYTR